MQGLMRSLIVVVLGGVMVACTPAPGASPTPEVSVTPSVTPTPTPQWTEEDQAAIDAVQHYLDVSSRIGQNLLDLKWDEIYDVAGGQALDDTTTTWVKWYNNGCHLVGAPTFTPEIVTTGATDGQGHRFHVTGCYDGTDAHLVDAAGKQIPNTGVVRGPAKYLVLHLQVDGSYKVIEDVQGEGTC